MELIKRRKTYVNKSGETKSVTQFYIIVDINGVKTRIAVDPHSYGEKGDTYRLLNLVAKYEK